jgi:hypothetical protein
MPNSEQFMPILKQVLLSPHVLIIAAAFIAFRYLVNAAISDRKPKPHKDKSTKAAKLKRPPAQKQALPKDVDTKDIGV